MENLISVIVATYNQEDTIRRTLDSILMQQCHIPYEIVIGEDCSTDSTRSICEEYVKEHPDTIRLFANKKNKGVINNYIDCILECRGKYIADCAGDDFWTDPLKLEKEVTILETHDDVTLVHTDWNRYYEDTKKTVASGEKPFTQDITDGKRMLEAFIIQTSTPVIHLCTSMYRTDIIRKAIEEDKYLFRNKDFGCEDLQIAFTMAYQGKIAYLPEVTLSYSQGKETITTSEDYHKQFCFVRQVSDLSYYLSQKYDIHSPAVDAHFQQRIYELGMHAFRAHDPLLVQKVIACEKKWNTKRTLKVRRLFAVLKHQWLWTLGLLFRNVIVSLKRLSH